MTLATKQELIDLLPYLTKQEIAEVDQILATIETPIMPYTYRGGNQLIRACSDIEAIVVGPAETGKTLALLTQLHTLAYQHPGAQFSIIRKKKTDLLGSVIRTFTRDILEKYGKDVVKYGGGHPQWYDYPNGSRIWLGGLDDPGKTLSSERDGIYVNQVEELSLPDWEYLTRCITGRGAVMENTFLRGDCNPAHPSHWIKSRAKSGTLKLFTTTHKDNPTLWDGEKWTAQGIRSRGILANMTGSRHKRLFQGLWATGEGAIYSIFDEARHKVKAYSLPLIWPRFVGIDPIGAHVAAIWLAYDPQNRVLHAYREHYEPFGITTAGHIKKILERSKSETIFAWVGGGPSETQSRLDWPAAGIPLIKPPITEIWPQIDRVINLLDTDSLVIHDSCPVLLDEIGDYKRVLKDGLPTEKIKDKDRYHCLVGDTLVSTKRGDVPIKDVQAGDYVLTRQGYKIVLGAECTNRAAKVYSVELSNGKKLIGTGNHLVWVKNKQYTDLLALRYGDIILLKEEVLCKEKLLNTGAELGGDIQIRKGRQTEIIIRQLSRRKPPIYTGTFGSSTTAQFQKDALFTTLTETRQTTLLKTSQCLRTPSMSISILRRNAACRLGNTQTTLGHLQPRGIERQRAKRGTANSEKNRGKTESQLQKNALCVAKNTKHSSQGKARAFAPVGVRRNLGGAVGLTTKQELAHFAGKCSRLTNIHQQPIVPVSVRRVTALAQRMPVYNLEVEEAHEFFANGILVHNCLDSLRYIVSYLAQPQEQQADIVYNPALIR